MASLPQFLICKNEDRILLIGLGSKLLDIGTVSNEVLQHAAQQEICLIEGHSPNLETCVTETLFTFVIVFIKALEISGETTTYKICNQQLNNNDTIYHKGEMFKTLSLKH